MGHRAMNGFTAAKDTTFCGKFQFSLTSRVEKDIALSKAVLITRKSKQEKEAASSVIKRGRPASFPPFLRGASCQVQKQVVQELLPDNPHRQPLKDGGHAEGRYHPTHQRPGLHGEH